MEENKATAIPLVTASKKGKGQTESFRGDVVLDLCMDQSAKSKFLESNTVEG